jgi:hypothetical protein
VGLAGDQLRVLDASDPLAELARRHVAASSAGTAAPRLVAAACSTAATMFW